MFPVKTTFLSMLAVISLTGTEKKTVLASSFGFDPKDATACLQKAIDSGAEKVIVDNPGGPWVVRPLKLRSRLHLLFRKDVIVEAKENEFRNKNDSLFSGENLQNITMEGETGAILRMRKKDYQNPWKGYSRSQWRNVIQLKGCYNVTIRKLTLASSGGDGIYIGRSYGKKGRIACRNILIENCLIDDHHRQGISVISAIGLTVRNCTISNTRGTEPEAGIDFEPNYPDEYFTDCLVENCRFIDNHWSGINCSIFSYHPVDLKIRNCTFTSKFAEPQLSFCLLEPFAKSGKGMVVVENCKVENNYSALKFMNFASDTNYRVIMRNTELTERKSGGMKRLRSSPIRFTATSPKTVRIGGVEFENVKVTGYEGVPLFLLDTMRGNKKVEKVTGTLIHNGRKRDAAEIVASDSALSRPPYRETEFAFSAPPANEGRKSSCSTPLRTASEIVIWGDKGENLSFAVEHLYFDRTPPTKAIGKTWKYVLKTPSGKQLALPEYQVVAKQPGQKKDFSVTAPESGLYKLTLSTFPRINRILTVFHGGEGLRWGLRGLPSQEGILNFRKQPGLGGKAEIEGYFEVPAGVSEFWIDCSSNALEVQEPSGKIHQFPAIRDLQRFRGKRGDTSKAEIWKIRVSRFVSCELLFSENLPGIISESPGNLPRAKTRKGKL